MRTDWKSFLISLLIWSFILFTLLPLFILYMIIWILLIPFDPKKNTTHFFTTIWTRLYLTFNPGWNLRIQNKEKISRLHPYVFISNHQSIIDIALILQLGINFKWISKIELRRVPFVGWVIWMNNHILVRRGDRVSVLQMAEACKKSLQNKISVFVFPEGTRSHEGTIQPFKEGAFIIAKDNCVPILPIVLEGTGEVLPKKSFWLKPRQTFTIRVLDEIPASVVSAMEIPELMHLCRVSMLNALTEIRNPSFEHDQ
jgi:1-acyl-sn-glycerol-3-phosphate acyltransferase